RRRPSGPGVDAGSRSAAAAADRDDLVRVHPGRRAAGVRLRGAGLEAPILGAGGVQRHTGRFAFLCLPVAGIILLDSAVRRGTPVRQPTDAPGPLRRGGRALGPGGRLPAGPARGLPPPYRPDRRRLLGPARRARRNGGSPATPPHLLRLLGFA